MRTRLEEATAPLKIFNMSRHNGFLNLTISHGWEIRFPDGILTPLCLDNGLGGALAGRQLRG